MEKNKSSDPDFSVMSADQLKSYQLMNEFQKWIDCEKPTSPEEEEIVKSVFGTLAQTMKLRLYRMDQVLKRLLGNEPEIKHED
ncbi:MAG TPA: hypothetical protein VI819_04520 [Patescibacteria group bacterium]|nr:hypothetical protein [Patescibacteria group bacterium]